MAVETKIRLFKIASEINIGKDAIVEFLQSKGVSVENKPSTTLTADMVELIYDKFKREKKAAEKQREKLQKHRDIRKAAGEKDIFEDIPLAKEELKKELTQPKGRIPEKDSLQISSVVQDQATKDTLPKMSDTQRDKTLSRVSIPTEKDTIRQIPKEVKTVDEKSIKISIPGKDKIQQSITESDKIKPELKHLDLTKDTEKVELSDFEKIKNEQADKEIIEEKTQILEEFEPQTTDLKSQTTQLIEKVTDKHEIFDEMDEYEGIETEDKAEIKQGKKKKKPKKIAEFEVGLDEDYFRTKGIKIVGRIDIRQPRFKKPKIKPPKKLLDELQDDVEDIITLSKPVKPKKKVRDKGSDVFDEFERIDEKRRKKRKKTLREQISQEEVDKAVKRTLSGIDEQRGMALRSRMRLKKRLEREEKELKNIEKKLKESTTLKLTEFVTTNDLANLMNVPPNEVIMKCIQLGVMVTLNQRLDKDTIVLIADDYGYQVEFVEEEKFLLEDELVEDESNLYPRPPIVTIMGHVDHGKTTLMDYIRHSNVVAGEAGGITQHIGAYRVELGNNKSITFLDTPGHEAFTAMRARGAQVTDIVVLVVAADDSVMPQTIEAINHAQAAKVPIVVAINKIDKPDSRPDRIKQQLSEHKILVEEWGGKNQCVEISAKFGQNIDQLLEKILLEAELLELKANPNRRAVGTIIESHLSKGLGIVATVIVQNGTLKIGDAFVSGTTSGRVRTMLDERGNKVDSASPSIPVGVIGFDGLPEAGDKLVVFSSETEAREIANKRQQFKREQEIKQKRPVSLDEISKNIQLGGLKELQLIIKGDVTGSVEALSDSLARLSNNEVGVSIIHKGVGTISESDVMLAVASGAVIIGFQVPIAANARRIAEREMVDIRLYNIIYDCIAEVNLALEGLLSPDIKEEITSRVEIRKLFRISKTGVIAGCYVKEGKINRNDRVRVMRDGMLIYNGTIHSLKRNKDDVRDVEQGFECGILLENFSDIEEGDIIEGYKNIEVKRTLSQ